jgi:PHD/YefM family antitoxin component YafN of YafNO toxin-antitoxin module
MIEVDVTTEQVIQAVKRMKKAQRDEFIEELLAATSPEYLASIRQARADARAGRVKSIDEVFGR